MAGFDKEMQKALEADGEYLRQMTSEDHGPYFWDEGDEEAATERLGRFGHHPDPAIDFCVEVETLEGEHFNTKIGFTNGTPTADELLKRVDRAMSFRVGGDLNAIEAKRLLRTIEEEMRKSTEPSRDLLNTTERR